MKKLLLVLMVLFTISSCTVEYTAVSHDAPILIKDSEGIVHDAIKMEMDTVYVVQHGMDDFYIPLRWMGDETTTFWSDTLSTGESIGGSMTYRKIAVSSIYER